MLVVRSYGAQDLAAVVTLWHACDLIVPWNDPEQDIQTKLRFQPELLLVGLLGERLVASVMAGYEGHRGWINYLAVVPELRRHGLGRRMMEEAELRLRSLGCPKINLQIRSRNKEVIRFYERLGYKLDEVVSMGKRL